MSPEATEVSRLFVYGTLMPGQPRWGILEPYVEGRPVTASVTGMLFDTGHGYPALFAGQASVPGVAVHLRGDRLDEALEVLDDVEGTAFGLFERRLACVDDHAAWVYYGHDPRLRGTPIDSWPTPHTIGAEA